MTRDDPTSDHPAWTVVAILALCLLVGPSMLAVMAAGAAGLCGYLCG